MTKTITTLADLSQDDRNANAGTPRGRGLVETSLQKYGAGRSVLVDRNGKLIAGNKTAEAAGSAGMDNVLVVQSDGTRLVVVQRTDLDLDTDTAARELAIADNRAGELGLEWDANMLAELGQEIDLSTFWERDELAALLAQDVASGDGGDDFDTTPEDGPTRVQLGELWQLGSHRLLCGDSTKAEDVARLMGRERAAMVLTDPPYGMRLDADFSGMKNNGAFMGSKGLKHGTRYDNVIGDHDDFNAAPIVALFEYTKEQFWFGADYYANTLGDTQHTGAWLVWDKRLDDSADRMYGSCFELIWSRQKHKRDMLRCKWAGVFGTEHEPQRGRQHPNQKPCLLLEEMINRYSEIDALIWDGYLGSGTTLIAAQRTGRRCYGIEISEKYCDVILRRWEAETGKTAERID